MSSHDRFCKTNRIRQPGTASSLRISPWQRQARQPLYKQSQFPPEVPCERKPNLGGMGYLGKSQRRVPAVRKKANLPKGLFDAN